jgi:hypothetical protein
MICVKRTRLRIDWAQLSIYEVQQSRDTVNA